jgi:phospholipid transport system substrate-binding protein
MKHRSKVRTNSVASILAALLAVAAAATSVRAEQTPSQVVSLLADKAIVVLGDKNTSTDQKRAQLEDLAYNAMDFEILSKLVLARNWQKFSPAQQKQFEDEFKRHLSITYGKNIQNYNNEKVQILGERPEAHGDVTVQTKILRGGGIQDVLVDYRLRQRNGQWKIIDVIVEGVSLVSNFRSQFQSIVSSGGPDRLLALLKEKNEKGETLAPTPTT